MLAENIRPKGAATRGGMYKGNDTTANKNYTAFQNFIPNQENAAKGVVEKNVPITERFFDNPYKRVFPSQFTIKVNTFLSQRSPRREGSASMAGAFILRLSRSAPMNSTNSVEISGSMAKKLGDMPSG